MLARPRMPSLANTLHTRACRHTRCACRLPWLIRLSRDTPHGTPAQSLGHLSAPLHQHHCPILALAATDSAVMFLDLSKTSATLLTKLLDPTEHADQWELRRRSTDVMTLRTQDLAYYQQLHTSTDYQRYPSPLSLPPPSLP